jgi:hypothetical protein
VSKEKESKQAHAAHTEHAGHHDYSSHLGADKSDEPEVAPLATYTPPSITASGTTFAQFQTGGISGHLERLIAAQTGLSTKAIEMARAGKQVRFQQVYNRLSAVVEEFNSGRPSSTANVAAAFADLATVFAMLNTLCNEAGTLIAANPGTLHTGINPVGNAFTYRGWP